MTTTPEIEKAITRYNEAKAEFDRLYAINPCAPETHGASGLKLRRFRKVLKAGEAASIHVYEFLDSLKARGLR